MDRPPPLGSKTKLTGNYKSIMEWHAETQPNSRLSIATNQMKDKMQELLRVMTQRHIFYRKAGQNEPYTIFGDNGNGKYSKDYFRIDSQTRVDLGGPDPRLNIQYQVDKSSYAIVVVHMKPIVAPNHLNNELIDKPPYGFTEGQVMGFVEAALKHSVANRCNTSVKWMICDKTECGEGCTGSTSYPYTLGGVSVTESTFDNRYNTSGKSKIDRKKTECREGWRSTSYPYTLGGVSVTESAVMATAKVMTKASLAEGTKYAAKTSCLYLNQNLNQIPGIGLGVGIGFGIYRLISMDVIGALGEVASGTASCFPGPGTAASLLIDAALLARDIKKP